MALMFGVIGLFFTIPLHLIYCAMPGRKGFINSFKEGYTSKECPYCKMNINEEATKCPHCQSSIDINIIKGNLPENELTELREIAGNDAVTFASADWTEWTCVCGRKNPQIFNKRKQSCSKCRRDRNEVLEKFQKWQ